MFNKPKEDKMPESVQESPAPVPSTEKSATNTDRLKQFDKVCAAGRKIFEEKNAQYGDSFARTGVLGATVTMIGDVDRLRQMVLKSPDFGKSQQSSIVEVLKDVHNYANMALLLLAEGNWDGN